MVFGVSVHSYISLRGLNYLSFPGLEVLHDVSHAFPPPAPLLKISSNPVRSQNPNTEFHLPKWLYGSKLLEQAHAPAEAYPAVANPGSIVIPDSDTSGTWESLLLALVRGLRG